MTRRGFLWRAHFVHRRGGGYYKFVRAWTPRGARRMARIYLHAGWTFNVERWPE